MGTGSFPGVKRPGRGVDHPPPSSAEVSKGTYHLSHYRGNVTAPYGCPNLRSRLHFSHNREGGPRSLYGYVVALKKPSNLPKLHFRWYIIDYLYNSLRLQHCNLPNFHCSWYIRDYYYILMCSNTLRTIIPNTTWRIFQSIATLIYEIKIITWLHVSTHCASSAGQRTLRFIQTVVTF
jgi:hypothetical protein